MSPGHTQRDMNAWDRWRALCECDIPAVRFRRLSGYIAVCQVVLIQCVCVGVCVGWGLARPTGGATCWGLFQCIHGIGTRICLRFWEWFYGLFLIK